MDDNALVMTLYDLEQFCNSVYDCSKCRLANAPDTRYNRCPIASIGDIREWLEDDMEKRAKNE